MFKIQFEIKSKMTAYVWAISGYDTFWHATLAIKTYARSYVWLCDADQLLLTLMRL